MDCSARRLSQVAVLGVAMITGCTKPTGQSSPSGDDKSVKDTFEAFQAALKTQDADKLWSLLDSDGRADAERAATATREAYAKASAEQKAEQEKDLGLSGAELAKLSGKGFLKSKRFIGTYDEVPDSKISKITIKGDTATIDYLEADGDKKKFQLVRQEGAWKLSLAMPK
jgi:hypothetical protein